MEESNSNQGLSKFGAFVDRIPGASLGSAGDMELHNMGSTSEAGVSLKVRRPLPSQFAMYETSMVGSNQRAVGFSHSDGLPDEQSLASALEDMALSFKNHTADSLTNSRNAVLINGHYPSRPVKSTSGLTSAGVTLNPPLVPAFVQDEPMPLQFSAEHVKQKPNELTVQKPNELTVEHQEQAHSFPLYFGNLPRSSGMHTMDSVSSTPYKPSAISASPFQPQFYIDGQSQMYAPYDQQVGSNFMWQHNMDAQKYPVMQPHYVYPQMQQAAGSDVHRIRSNRQAAVCTSAKGASAYLGTPNVHQLELGSEDPYWNGASFQKGNNQLNSTFVNRFPSTLYPDNSCGSGNFRQQAERFAHPYELNSFSKGFSPRHISDNLSKISYPEKILMQSASVNSVRTTKFAPLINGCNGMDRRIDGYGHNHLDIQSNDSLHLDRQNSQFLSLQSEYELAMKSCQLNYNSVDEIAGRICMLAKDQNGCRFLQKVFTEGTQEDIEKVFAEIIDHIGELMVDPFGNYLVQKLLEECNEDQMMRIICEITKVSGDLITVSCNMHGTRAVQKVIETINTPDQVSKVVSALSPGALRLMTDTNGSHVAHRCLQKLLPEYKAFLLDAATLRYVKLAKDRQGCCIIQKCIEHSNDEQKYNLLSNITSNALSLSEDQYGNYVIQFILTLNIDWATAKIVDELEGHFGYLSLQKCGSHVVENCLKLAPQLERDRIINELMNDPKLPQIMRDQFGNYVIQTALKECKGALHTAFVEAIRPHAASLQSNMFGKRVLSRTYLKNKQYRLGIL